MTVINLDPHNSDLLSSDGTVGGTPRLHSQFHSSQFVSHSLGPSPLPQQQMGMKEWGTDIIT
jgi:hypothetical protein